MHVYYIKKNLNGRHKTHPDCLITHRF
jgi:hypothetical protein